jgi:hypothetical protein
MKATTVEPKEMHIARKRHGKQVSSATSTHTTMEEKIEAVFSMQSMPRQHNEDQWEKKVSGELALVVGG